MKIAVIIHKYCRCYMSGKISNYNNNDDDEDRKKKENTNQGETKIMLKDITTFGCKSEKQNDSETNSIFQRNGNSFPICSQMETFYVHHKKRKVTFSEQPDVQYYYKAQQTKVCVIF